MYNLHFEENDFFMNNCNNFEKNRAIFRKYTFEIELDDLMKFFKLEVRPKFTNIST